MQYALIFYDLQLILAQMRLMAVIPLDFAKGVLGAPLRHQTIEAL